MSSIKTFITTAPPKTKAMLAASIVGVVVLAFAMVTIASRPSYATLLSGVDPAEMGKVTAALDEKGIAYELQNNGTAIGVDKAMGAQARVALAEQGLPSQGKPGFEIFDEQKLGMSDFQQQVAYQRALEGEIARTVEQVDGVSGAKVELVLPEEQLFESEQSPAKAAVLLSGDPGSLEQGAVRGIAQLVASSVKGLKTSDVTITDGAGKLVWPTAGSESGGGAATAKQAADARYEAELRGNLESMLTRSLGPNQAHVQVNADLNTDEATREELKYDKKGVALKESKEKENLQGGSGGGGGAAGVTANLGDGAAGGAGGGSQYDRNSESTDFGVGKTITRTKVAPGAVNRQDVAVLVDAAGAPAGGEGRSKGPSGGPGT